MPSSKIADSKIVGYYSGPASTHIVVDRSNNDLGLDDIIRVQSSLGNDFVVGTDGKEDINTGKGHDYIFPVFGSDTVNGAAGEDIVDYRLLRAALTFISEDGNVSKLKVEGSSEDDPHTSRAIPGRHPIEVNKDDYEGEEELDFEFMDYEVDAILTNVEGINAFAGSYVDFSELPDPSNSGMGVYKATLGSGSTFKGSEYADYVEIDFSEYYNSSVDNAFSSFTNLEGGGNSSSEDEENKDILFVDLSTYQGDDRGLSVLYDEDDDAWVIYNKEKQILEATGFELIEFKGGETDELVSFKGSSLSHRHEAGAGDDVVKGGDNAAQLFGNEGSDDLDGGPGADTLTGGSGSDVLFGGKGSDVMRGGANADTYRLSSGNDIILDFTSGLDVIEASSIPELEQQESGVLLSYSGGETLLLNVTLDAVKDWLTTEAGGLEILA